MATNDNAIKIRQMRSLTIEVAVCPFKRAALEFELEEFWKALAALVRRRESQLRETYGVPIADGGTTKPCGCRESGEP